LEVSLTGNPSTGYMWEINALETNVLQSLGDAEFIADNPNVVGGGGKIIRRFETVDIGQTLLRLWYHRAWETDVPPLETFEVTVVVTP